MLVTGVCTILAVAFILLIVLNHQLVAAHKNEIRAYRKMMAETATVISDFERERIAKNLHDDVGTILNVLSLNLDRLSRNIHNDTAHEKLVKESVDLLNESISNIRCISKDLIPLTLMKCGYEKALAELCRQINVSGRIKIEVLKSEQQVQLEPQVELHLYRITQEVLNNLLKHAQPAYICIRIQSALSGVTILVEHNGKSIDTERIKQLTAAGNGLGLRNIESRTALINARVKYTSSEKNTSRITIEVPAYGQN